MMLPADQSRRRRFIEQVERCFGVVAPAGVGKTQAIVERVARMAGTQDAVERLSRLVVVTYTARAAAEMQRRARQKVLEANASVEVQAAFNRAFFGTIHSFCLRLLRQHGHHIGVPARVQLVEDDADVWQRFLQDADPLEGEGVPACLDGVLRLLPARGVLEMGRFMSDVPSDASPIDQPPQVALRAALDFVVTNKRSLKTIERSQQALRHWQDAWQAGRFAPLPEPETTAKEFVAVWSQVLAPLRDWLREAALKVATHVGVHYREFRLKQGLATFGDQIALAADLFHHPVAAAAIRHEHYQILLDEAQDTDPVQFRVLCAAAGWPVGDAAEHENERALTMVGDPQQSIYGSRADVATYQDVQQRLAEDRKGEALTLSVTFRCDRAIVEFANANFPCLLDGHNGQADYVPLDPRPEATAGQVLRLPIAEDGEDAIAAEAAQVAAYLRRAGLQRLRASAWGRVAILCPRKRWFAPLAAALKAEGIPIQQQTFRECYGDNPAYAWLTALLWVLTHPRDGYELVGVLREIFAISDHDLAAYAKRDGTCWRLDAVSEGEGDVPNCLRDMAALWRRVSTLSVGDAVAEILRHTGLRERLAALADFEVAESVNMLDDLCIRIAALEARRTTLLEVAEELRAGGERVREDRAANPDALHILTCQKAKGLEWDAVVVPYLFRAIKSRNDSYPRLVRTPGSCLPQVQLGKEDVSAEGRGFEWRELARLLYVTATRARHTLVWVDDEAVLGKAGRADPDFGTLLLGPNEENRERFTALPSEPLPDEEMPKAQAELVLESAAERTPSIESVDLVVARLRARDYPERTTPYRLAREPQAEDPEARADRQDDEPDRSAATPGTIYGTWWHELIAEVPWNQAVESWEKVYTYWQKRCPDPERGRREWEAMLASDVPTHLARDGVTVRPEMPFLWRESAKRVVEGVVDAACYDATTDEWFILDWKTNRLTQEQGMDHLEYLYAAQVAAYAQAFASLFAKPTRAALYSTVLGQWRDVEIS